MPQQVKSLFISFWSSFLQVLMFLSELLLLCQQLPSNCYSGNTGGKGGI